MNDNAAAAGIGMGILFVYLLMVVAIVAAIWRIFTKAGKPGWAAIVPFYNLVVLLEILGKPLWWLILMVIPLVNAIVGIILSISLAERFGKGAGFGLGIAFLGFIFLPMLAFGDAQYSPPTATPNALPA